MKEGYAIFINALAEGCVPLVRDGNSRPFVFSSERDFEDAVTIEEFVVKVQVHPDGSIEDECGTRFS
jgi:hypothetical protein